MLIFRSPLASVRMAASIPSTGLELLYAFQLGQALDDGLAAAGGVGDPLRRHRC